MGVSCHGDRPVEAVHHLEVCPQVLLGEVVQHAGVHQTLHEVGAVLGQAQAGQPLVTYPLMVHIPIRQGLQEETRGQRVCVCVWVCVLCVCVRESVCV